MSPTYDLTERTIADLRTQIHNLQRTVSFFASVIKSGEPWSEECEKMRKEVMIITSEDAVRARFALGAEPSPKEIKEWEKEFLTETPLEYRKRTTTDGQPPEPGYENASAPGPIDPKTGQHKAYWVLSEEERKKGWARPLRRKYIHKKCGVVTSMGLALCETYATNPKFYSHTFCVGCGDHLPVSEFTWDEDGTEVGS